MKIGVYGLGRFGKFWAQEFARHNNEVLGYSRNIKEDIEGVKQVDEDTFLASCDVIYFCVAISAFEKVIKNVSDRLKPGTIVVDTCSVKVYPSKIMRENLPKDVYSIASHPMFGPDSGKNGVKGLPLVIFPISCPKDVYNGILNGFKSWQLEVLEMSPDSHDREAAWSQGITHFVGRVLDELALQPTELATTGYRRLMSIVEQTCNDPIQLFHDLQKYNPYAKQMRMGLKGALDYVMQDLVSQED
ncbi:MAG: prephenate dehydrogenase/arogenate dehydrogenase family protein [Pleomorphochaeta sp.]